MSYDLPVRRSLALLVVSVGCGPVPASDPMPSSTTGGQSAESSTASAQSRTSAAESSDSGSSGGGSTSSSSSGDNVCEVAVPCAGCESWRDEFDGRTGDNDWFLGVASAPNGDVIAFGAQNVAILSGGPGDARIARYSAAGVLQWAQTLSAEEGSFFAVSGLVEDDGTIVIALENAFENGPGRRTWLARLDGQGELIGAPEFLADAQPIGLLRVGDEILLHSYGSYSLPAGTRLERLSGSTLEPVSPPEAFEELDRRGLSMVTGPNNTVLVAGTTPESAPYLARLSAEDGVWGVEWSLQQFDTIEGEASIAAAAGLDDGSSVFVALADDTLITGRLDPEQQPVWTRTQDFLQCGYETRVQVAVDPEDRMFLLGRTPSQNGAARLLALSGCDGSTLWTWDVGDASSFGTTVTVADNRLFAAGWFAQRFGDTRAWVTELEL